MSRAGRAARTLSGSDRSGLSGLLPGRAAHLEDPKVLPVYKWAVHSPPALAARRRRRAAAGAGNTDVVGLERREGRNQPAGPAFRRAQACSRRTEVPSPNPRRWSNLNPEM